MSDTTSTDARRLFMGACFALIATSVAFATVGAVMLALKRDFILTNQQVGWIGGAALWGFAVSQLIFAPLCDTLGMRFLPGFSALVTRTVSLTASLTASIRPPPRQRNCLAAIRRLT